ncbi:MAG: hypothetical protein KAI53_00135 [Candidatus Aenigmarchaeota archaeon]|nr:hypothetical protein [Candidatus Aenigmarchaeota archaeon]
MVKTCVYFDLSKKVLTISLNPRLYPQNIVMRAAYRFIDDFDVKVCGDSLSEFKVRFKSKDTKGISKEDFDALSDAFFTELVHTSVEEAQARRYADIRNALVGAALKNMVPSVDVGELALKMKEKTKVK